MNTEKKKRYFTEAALALDREGFRAEMFHGNKLSVWWDDEPLCEISDGGAVITTALISKRRSKTKPRTEPIKSPVPSSNICV